MKNEFEPIINNLENNILTCDSSLLKLRVNNPKHERKIRALNALKQMYENAIKKLES